MWELIGRRKLQVLDMADVGIIILTFVGLYFAWGIFLHIFTHVHNSGLIFMRCSPVRSFGGLQQTGDIFRSLVTIQLLNKRFAWAMGQGENILAKAMSKLAELANLSTSCISCRFPLCQSCGKYKTIKFCEF